MSKYLLLQNLSLHCTGDKQKGKIPYLNLCSFQQKNISKIILNYSDSDKQFFQLFYIYLDHGKEIESENLISGIVQEEGYCFC